MAKSRRGRKPTRRTYHHGDQARGRGGRVALDVARGRAGVTHSAPYHHFPTRTALLAAVAEEGFRELYTEQLQNLTKAGPVARLESLGVSYVRFAVNHPGRFRVMFRSDPGGWTEHPEVDEAGQLSFTLLSATADAALKANQLDVELSEFILAAWSVVHGLATLWADGPLRRVPILVGDRTIEEVAVRIAAVSTGSVSVRKPS
ncbi:MAG TPA: TetR-like C-terminal domain-containing protein [Polyangiaceae bacterium]|jgi:AcrR family transcriptional regulator|nr:TetR-like C-terminal domain-containing protein [Polyangiaceae bacterium]